MSIRNKLFISSLSICWFYFLGGIMGVSIILMIALHELGHLWAAKRLGYETGGFFLTPLGGLAMIKERMRNLTDRFVISLAGPLVGTLLSVLALGIYCFWRNEFIFQMARIWALINLFNLLPVFFLDGGQASWCIGNSISTNYGFKYWFIIPTFWGLSMIFFVFGSTSIIIFGTLFFVLGLKHLVKREIWSLRKNIPMKTWEVYVSITAYTVLFIELVVLFIY